MITDNIDSLIPILLKEAQFNNLKRIKHYQTLMGEVTFFTCEK